MKIALLKSGADPNVTDGNGDTPLHGCKSLRLVEALLVHGGDPNAANEEGNTPLHLCEASRIMNVLLEHGGDTQLRNKVISWKSYQRMRPAQPTYPTTCDIR